MALWSPVSCKSMIYSVDADQPGFKRVEFTPGFNVVLAERTKDSTDKDSRNGLGKSTLLDIIHFLLGSAPGTGDVLRQAPLEDWTFTMELNILGKVITVRRNTTELGKIVNGGDTTQWPIKLRIDAETGERFLTREEWTRLLGWAMFDLPPLKGKQKYPPSFRALISYFIRRDQGAFIDPFEQNRDQKEWDKQLHTAFLLGLNWQHAQTWQLLRERTHQLNELQKALKTGAVSDFIGSIGTLQSTRVRLERAVQQELEALGSFRVHRDYRDIEDEANRLTVQIKRLTNANVTDQGMIGLYERT